MKGPIIFLTLLFLISSCKSDKSGTQFPVTTNIQIDRFETALFGIDPAQIDQYLPQWQEKYKEFFNHYCWITGIGTPSDTGFSARIRAFVTDRNNYQLYKRTLEVFPDLTDVTAQLNKAFSNYVHYFPGMPVPKIYSFISGLSQSAITDDSLLAIGLDRYLGAAEPFYREAGIYNYLTSRMHAGKIASDCMYFWSETEFPFHDSVNNLIANMIYQGRTLYFTEKMLPEQPDTLTLGFSGRHLEYLEEYEKSMWAFLVEHKLLFNTERFIINKYILEGPFTTDFGRNSPARAAVWIGYRITDAFMKRNSETELMDLMLETDYLRILNDSGYNP